MESNQGDTMKTIFAMTFFLLASCSEPNLNELKLDYSSQEISENSLSQLQSKLSKDQYYKLMQVISSVKKDAARNALKDGKEYSAQEWEKVIFEESKKALHGQSIAELIN